MLKALCRSMLLAGLSACCWCGTQDNPAPLIKAKKFKEAEVLCRKALEADPEDPRALMNLGLCLEGEGRRREAMHHWDSLRAFEFRVIKPSVQE